MGLGFWMPSSRSPSLARGFWKREDGGGELAFCSVGAPSMPALLTAGKGRGVPSLSGVPSGWPSTGGGACGSPIAGLGAVSYISACIAVDSISRELRR